MRFPNQLFGNKSEEKQAQIDVEAAPMPEKNEETSGNDVEKIAKKHFKELFTNMHIVKISTNDEGMYKIVRESPQGNWKSFWSSTVIFEETMNVDALLEYLKTLTGLKVHFSGPLEAIKNILERINLEWYQLQSGITIKVTDGLEHYGLVQRQHWMQLIVRHFQKISAKSFKLPNNQRVATSSYFATRVGYYARCIKAYDEILAEFVVFCKGMDIPSYDISREVFINGVKMVCYTRDYWDNSLKMIKAEADLFNEEENRIEYEYAGIKRVVVFKERSIDT